MGKFLTKKEDDYSAWYNEIINKAGLAESSSVKGCMVIKPDGFAIWENMQAELDRVFKATGHQNAYFPLFIPKSFFSKEASHVKGFAKECAVITHYRLKNDKDNKVVVDETAKLDEELIVRPTSETIIWNSYRNWIQSYRDLPILLNQWANVVRWEMRTRLFLRTTEFLWQEGHTAHATKKEALIETEKMIGVYADFAKNFMALPVIIGTKTENERFAGAEETYTIEAMMQDGKALQAGTSHFLAQNFAKAFDVKYTNKEGKQEFVWASSWGVSTRLIGALIMAHSDNNGLVLPPKLAPIEVAIIPIYRNTEQFDEVDKYIKNKILPALEQKNIRYKYDNRDTYKPGWKFSEYELKGVPLRIAVGPKDIEKKSIELARRDTLEKTNYQVNELSKLIPKLLNEIQENLYKKALSFRKENTHTAENYEELKNIIKNKKGFVIVNWEGSSEDENKIKAETKATIRCKPRENENFVKEGKCIMTGKMTKKIVIFAKAY